MKNTENTETLLRAFKGDFNTMDGGRYVCLDNVVIPTLFVFRTDDDKNRERRRDFATVSQCILSFMSFLDYKTLTLYFLL